MEEHHDQHGSTDDDAITPRYEDYQMLSDDTQRKDSKQIGTSVDDNEKMGRETQCIDEGENSRALRQGRFEQSRKGMDDDRSQMMGDGSTRATRSNTSYEYQL